MGLDYFFEDWFEKNKYRIMSFFFGYLIIKLVIFEVDIY